MRTFLAAASLFVLLALAGGAGAQGTTLLATVGPGFFIKLTDSAGNPVRHLDAGTYTIQVDDKGDLHNFHLTGPGVDKATDIDQIATLTWTVTFADGIYHFQCDAHPLTMKGDFAVGTATLPAPAPPPTTKPKPAAALVATVGPAKTIRLTRLGRIVRTLKAGPVVVTVHDRSATDNFRLKGPGVNRATSKPGKVNVVWKLTLKAGLYTYRSDATLTLKGTLRVTA